MKNFLTTSFVASLAFFPLFVFAAPPANLRELIKRFTDLINPIIGLMTGLAVLFFVWGIAMYILKAGDEKSKTAGKNVMVYGVIGLTVLFSFWGIVAILRESFFE